MGEHENRLVLDKDEYCQGVFYLLHIEPDSGANAPIQILSSDRKKIERRKITKIKKILGTKND